MVNMKKHFSIALTCLLAAGLLYGCASTQETSTMQQSISMLHERQSNLERRFESVDAQAQRGGDLYARMDELQVRIGALNGRIEELEHRINQVARVQAQHPPVPAQPSSESAPPPASPPVSAPAPPAATTAPSSPPPPPPPVEKENPEKVQYDKAMQSFQQGKFDNARKELQQFLSKYPKSEFADNALFTVGECYYAEKKYSDAIETYQQVMDRYPRGNRVPHALLKQGSAFQAMGDNTAARILFERVVEKYPGTPQAQAAEKKLKQLP